MAITFVKKMTDDLDGSEGASTVTFGYQGNQYEIELGSKNAAKLDSVLKPFIAAARHAGRASKPKKKQYGKNVADPQIQAQRDWARQNGYNVSDKGRIPAEVRLAYEQAHETPKVQEMVAQ